MRKYADPNDAFNNAAIPDLVVGLSAAGRPGAALLLHVVSGLIAFNRTPDDDFLALGRGLREGMGTQIAREDGGSP